MNLAERDVTWNSWRESLHKLRLLKIHLEAKEKENTKAYKECVEKMETLKSLIWKGCA